MSAGTSWIGGGIYTHGVSRFLRFRRTNTPTPPLHSKPPYGPLQFQIVPLFAPHHTLRTPVTGHRVSTLRARELQRIQNSIRLLCPDAPDTLFRYRLHTGTADRNHTVLLRSLANRIDAVSTSGSRHPLPTCDRYNRIHIPQWPNGHEERERAMT